MLSIPNKEVFNKRYFALYSTVIITFVIKDLNVLINLDFIL